MHRRDLQRYSNTLSAIARSAWPIHLPCTMRYSVASSITPHASAASVNVALPNQRTAEAEAAAFACTTHRVHAVDGHIIKQLLGRLRSH